jgi:DNA-binding transcriptional LysR family regulator
MLYLTLRQYEYVVGIADAGSLTKAATRLNVSQPSLSVAITRVEQRLQSPLFVRGKGAAIALTPYGHSIVTKARAVLELAATIEQEKDPSPTYVLGCFEDIAPWYLAPALNRLSNAFPDISFQGREGRFADIARDLAEGRMDIATSYDVGFAGPFRRRKIRDVAPVAFLAADHPLAQNQTVDLSDLAHDPLILFSEDLSEGYMRDLFERVQLAPVIQQKVASLEMMRSLAAHGVGVGISYSHPPNDISYDGKRLVTVPINTPEAKAEISLIWSTRRRESPEFEMILKVLSVTEPSEADSPV